jgi:2-keto-4-pentenoate hydratase/2-oxohepta-3-ene-1,7-dioic acid hydratase in catechol pathway
MQIVTYIINVPGGSNQTPRVGAILPGGDHILDFALATEPALSGTSQLSWLDMDGVPFQRALAAYKKVRSTERDLDTAIRDGLTVKRSDVTLLAPVPRPGKLICIGLNYRDHAEESNMPIPERPVVFSKFTTSVIGPGQHVVVPSTSEKVDYEAELAVVIGRYAKNVSLELALDYVLGYTIVNDISARDFQFADGQWQRGKSCDTFAPMGEIITTADEIPDPQNLSIKLRLNGNTMQDSNTDQLIFGIRELIAFLSETITLEPGDVIATGTPPGVGFARKPPVFLKDGDVMEVEIEGLGILINPVTAAAS